MREKMNISTTSSPFSSEVDGDFIEEDSFEDGCSICLEPFISLDPAFVTKCEHQYHLQCILEWSQRSSQCPVCLQHLAMNDPASQEMMAAAEREKRVSQKTAHQENEHSHERLTMRRVAAMGARMITRRRRRPSDLRHCFSSMHSSTSLPPPAVHRDSSMLQRRSRTAEFAAMSDSLRAKLSTASVRYRESLSKGTRSFKAKIMARNDSVKELSRGVQREMSAGIAGISRLIARKRAELCIPSGSPRVEEDSVDETLLHTTQIMSLNRTNAVAQEA